MAEAPVQSLEATQPLSGLARPQREHIVELDSLRGGGGLLRGLRPLHARVVRVLAAALRHLPFYVPFLANGAAAVMMFFVLSGFVLSLPMQSGEGQSYPLYVVRRICRIYLPYLAALLITLVACWGVHASHTQSPILGYYWQTPPSLRLVMKHLAFLGRYDVYAYNGVTWSLVHEMRISLIFPLLCLMARGLRPSVACSIAVLFPVVGRLVDKYSVPLWQGDGTRSLFWSATIGFCGLFLVGSLLARYRKPLVAWLMSLPAALRWILPVVAIGFYQYPALLHIPRAMQDFATGLGAAYFLILSLVPGGWLSRLLRLSPLRFLGRISYSLYLIHSPILILTSIAIWGRMPYIYLLLPCLALSFGCAALFYRLVEQPSIALGRAISQRWQHPSTIDGAEVVASGLAG